MKTTLANWAKSVYGDAPPHIKTLRRWCSEGKIFPIPEKHGRAYYVEKNARYVGDYNSPEFIGRLRDAAQTQ